MAEEAPSPAPSFGEIPTKQLKIVFKKYVDKSTATTSKTAGADKKPLAGTCTSVGTLLEKCVGKKYKDANDSIVFKKYTDKTKGSQTFGKLKADTFCSKEFWLELEAIKIEAEKKVKKPSHDDPDVVAGATQTMAKVASFHAVETTTAKKPTSGKAGAVTDRLTDPKKYTGSHKERFDESGKGRGATGRKDLPSGSGYVGSYKGEGTHGRGSNTAQKLPHSKASEKTPRSKSVEKLPHSKPAEKTPKSRPAERRSSIPKLTEKTHHSKSAEKTTHSKSTEKTHHSKLTEKTHHSKSTEKSQHSKSGEKSASSKSAEKSASSKSTDGEPESKTDTGSQNMRTDETGKGSTANAVATGSSEHVPSNQGSQSPDKK